VDQSGGWRSEAIVVAGTTAKETTMTEAGIRRLIEKVRLGHVSRRAFIERMGVAGVAMPFASLLLMDAGIAQTSAEPEYKPTKRGGGGPLRMLYWQGPTQLNPHFVTGTKDGHAANLFYESLARWDRDAVFLPVLAAEIPSRENGGIAADGRSVTWKLKQGVKWHDGAPFTADDVIFNWRFATNPDTAAITSGAYLGMKLEMIDSHTVRVIFDKPTPFWPRTYSLVLLIPKHLFEPYIGSKSREAPQNLKPVGTGPYRIVDFRPGDMVRGELNPTYHMPNRPHFDTVEIKGGGDAPSAARAVLQTGEFDYAWNLQVEDELLKKIEADGKGRVITAPGGSVEFIELNYADPNVEIDGERAHANSRHPLWQHAPVRQAMSLLVDRASIEQHIYGRGGIATANVIANPPRYRSTNTHMEFSVDKANAVLDTAGWKRGSDGIREKGGRRLQVLYQTSINGPRQKVQAVVKQACQRAGIEVELKSVMASVYFGGDATNPDTNTKFWADMQMYTQDMGPPDPQRFMDRYTSWEIARKANKWQGRNLSRWRSEEYDTLYRAAEQELDPVKRAALFIRMNDLVCTDNYVIPLLYRPEVDGAAKNLVLSLSGWANATGNVHSWFREG
jgi:peptide/nickel transport system substrate-binding protein